MRQLLLLVCLMLVSACATTEYEQSKEYRIADTNVRLAVGYMQQGRMDDALVKLKKALSAVPDYRDAHSAIAIVYDRLGEFSLADDHYREAIDLDSDNGAVYNNYGVFLCAQGKLEKAIRYFLRAIDTPRYATTAQAYENAGACAKKIPDLDLAETYLRKALSIDPKLPLALYTMAEIAFQQKRYLSTRAYLERYAEVGQHTAESLWIGIQAERALGDNASEERYAKLLQTKFPDSVEFKKLLDTSWGGN